jgi:hemoglobin-like flavoprotein
VTPEQRQLLQKSWATLDVESNRLAELFYNRLFELDPSVQPLFANTDMAVQRKKFMDMLGEIVKVVDNTDAVVPTVVSLARRHAWYGVESPHYESVGQALIWMLEEGLGDEFSDDVRRAWADAYRFVAALMQRTTGGTAAQSH